MFLCRFRGEVLGGKFDVDWALFSVLAGLKLVGGLAVSGMYCVYILVPTA